MGREGCIWLRLGPDPVTLDKSPLASDAARAMSERDTGAILVTEDGERICGVVTDRGIVMRAIAEDRNPAEVPLADICSKHQLATVSPEDDVNRAVEIMRERHIRRLPVVEDGHPVGVSRSAISRSSATGTQPWRISAPHPPTTDSCCWVLSTNATVRPVRSVVAITVSARSASALMFARSTFGSIQPARVYPRARRGGQPDPRTASMPAARARIRGRRSR